jgi:hypothetical protein
MTIEQEANADGQDAGEEQGQEQGELQGTSLLTKPDDPADAKDGKGGTKPDAGKEQKEAAKPGKDDPADKVPDKPEGYALKFAKDTQVDKELLGSFQKEAHALGIKPSQAQKLASLYEAHAAKAGERMQAEQRKVLETAKTQWEAEIEKSPNFAQEREHARATLRQFGDKELYDLLDQTNLGSHPKMWAFLAKVGKALAEPGFHGKGGKAKEEASLASRMWPNM